MVFLSLSCWMSSGVNFPRPMSNVPSHRLGQVDLYNVMWSPISLRTMTLPIEC